VEMDQFLDIRCTSQASIRVRLMSAITSKATILGVVWAVFDVCFGGQERTFNNPAVRGISCVLEFWDKMAKPPQNGTKHEMSF
ncbi:MAG: hypothetical protein V7696_20155, partial [Halioglobus sp.]